MLIEFKFSSYRSFRDEAVLSMEATGLGTFRKSLIEYRPAGKSTNHPIHLLPAAAIYGKNGGGKSNVIRAFWLAVQFIRNAQRTQHEKAPSLYGPFCWMIPLPQNRRDLNLPMWIKESSIFTVLPQPKSAWRRNTFIMRRKANVLWCSPAPARSSTSLQTT